MKCTSHPNFPVRVVAVCKDSAIRIMTPSSGEVLTTLLLEPNEDRVVDVAYAIADGNSCCVAITPVNISAAPSLTLSILTGNSDQSTSSLATSNLK